MSSQRISIDFKAGQTEMVQTFRIVRGDPQGHVVGSLAENTIGTAVREYYITYRDVPGDPAGLPVRALAIVVQLHDRAARDGAIALNIICPGDAEFGPSL